MPVHEEAQVFEAGGLACRDPDAARRRQRSAAGRHVIPNAGLIYRIGPRRFSVKLARALAEAGIPTLRFDLAGVGDSKYVGESSSARRRTHLASMRSALRPAQAYDRCAPLHRDGDLLGAVNAYHRIATVDERVVGVFMYDKFYYRSRWTTPVYLAKRAWVVGPGRAVVAALRALSRRRP